MTQRPPQLFRPVVRMTCSPLAQAASCCSVRSGCGASCDCDARLFWQGLEDQINSYVDNHTLAQFMRVNEKTPAVLNGTERR